MYTYRVKPGESVATIAAKFSGTENDILFANTNLPRKM